MKITASILLFYFSFLAMQPLIPLIQKAFSKEDSCGMTCCHKMHSKAKPQTPNNNCCNGMTCNPLGQYACCIGYVIEKEPVIRANMENSTEILTLKNLTEIKSFCADCWRPPENIVI